MAYESRIYIVDRSEYAKDDEYGAWCEVIAQVNMSSVDGGFLDCFTEELDGYFYAEGTKITEDSYGKRPTVSEIAPLVDFMEKKIAEGNTYRRYVILLGLLKGINKHQWNDLRIVHCGY